MKKILLAIACLSFVLIGIICYSLYEKRDKRNSEARKFLKEVFELETAYKDMFGHYTDNIYALVFIQDTLVTDGGKAIYQITIQEVTDSTFTATAISVVDFDGDGQFNKWVIDETGCIKEIIKD